MIMKALINNFQSKIKKIAYIHSRIIKIINCNKRIKIQRRHRNSATKIMKMNEFLFLH